MSKIYQKQVVILISLAFFAISCEKSKELNELENLPTQEFLSIDKRLSDFKNNLLTSQVNQEPMSVDNAVWYIEGLLNRTYAQQNSETIKTNSIQAKTYAASFNHIQEEINFDEVVNSYNKFKEYCQNIIVQELDINITLIDVYIKNNKLNLTICYGRVEKKISTTNADYWHAVLGLGKCRGNSDEFIGRDAATELGWRANRKIPQISAGYFTSVESILVDNYSKQSHKSNNFWMETSNFPEDICLSPDEMDQWLLKFEEAIRIYKPENKELVNCTGYSTYKSNGKNEAIKYMHVAKPSYGTLVNIEGTDVW